MTRWIIQDWMGNRLFPKETFASFDSAWGRIYETVPDEDNAYDDFYVIEVMA